MARANLLNLEKSSAAESGISEVKRKRKLSKYVKSVFRKKKTIANYFCAFESCITNFFVKKYKTFTR